MKTVKFFALITSLLLAEASFAAHHDHHPHPGGAARAVRRAVNATVRATNRAVRATNHAVRATNRAVHAAVRATNCDMRRRVLNRAPVVIAVPPVVQPVRIVTPQVVSVLPALSPADRTLLAAAREGNHRKLRKALERGACVNAVQANGQTALHLVAKFGDQKCAKILLRHGANRNLLNQFNNTPAQVAMNQGKLSLAGFINTFL